MFSGDEASEDVTINQGAVRPEATRLITRGARRLLRAHGFSVLTEFSLPNGRRAVLFALSSDGRLRIVEVKSSPDDFRADSKWRDYRACCDLFYFAIGLETPEEIFPPDAGLIVADAHGAMLQREAPAHPLAAATRRALLLRFAMTAAERFNALAYPDPPQA